MVNCCLQSNSGSIAERTRHSNTKAAGPAGGGFIRTKRCGGFYRSAFFAYR
jgi:hypothetical protein